MRITVQVSCYRRYRYGFQVPDELGRHGQNISVSAKIVTGGYFVQKRIVRAVPGLLVRTFTGVYATDKRIHGVFESGSWLIVSASNGCIVAIRTVLDFEVGAESVARLKHQ